MLAPERQHADADHDEERDGAADHRLGAEPVVEAAADRRARRAGDGEQDTEDAELPGLPAEHAGAVDAAEREEGDEGVLIDHVGEEEPPDARVPSRVLDGGPDLLEPLITASRRERPVRGISGVKKKSGKTKTRNQAARDGR